MVERLLGQAADGPRFERSVLEGELDPNDHPAAVPTLPRRLAIGAQTGTEVADNIRSLAMVHAALAAARDGGWVTVEP